MSQESRVKRQATSIIGIGSAQRAGRRGLKTSRGEFLPGEGRVTLQARSSRHAVYVTGQGATT